jgi:hypothetical protein
MSEGGGGGRGGGAWYLGYGAVAGAVAKSVTAPLERIRILQVVKLY